MDGVDDRSSEYEQFLRRFAENQFRILAYIMSLIPDQVAAQDVYQETALLLWKSFSTYDREQSFLRWSLGVARHQVLRYWRTCQKDRHVFSDMLLDQLADEGMKMADELEPRQVALKECLSKLTARQSDLIRQFYGEGRTAGVIAEAWGRSVHAVYKALKTVRRALLECIERKLAEDC